MVVLSVIFLAVAVSFDALAIGITYGMNRITIALWPKVILSLVSGFSVFLAMFLGQLLSRFLTAEFTAVVGGLIFIVLGLYNLWRSYRTSEEGRVLLNWRIPILGLIVQVFQEPLAADSDQSKDIKGAEAIVLGGALALDAMAAGIAAALLQLPPFLTTISVMAASFLFIAQGLKTGRMISALPKTQRDLRWVPGLIIIVIGIAKLFF